MSKEGVFSDAGFLDAWNVVTKKLDRLIVLYNISTDHFKIVDVEYKCIKYGYMKEYYGDFQSDSSVYRQKIISIIFAYKKIYNRDLKLDKLLNEK